jgi:hypothetical protein
MAFPAGTGSAAIREAKWTEFTSGGRTLVKGAAKAGISRHDGAIEAGLGKLTGTGSGIALWEFTAPTGIAIHERSVRTLRILEALRIRILIGWTTTGRLSRRRAGGKLAEVAAGGTYNHPRIRTNSCEPRTPAHGRRRLGPERARVRGADAMISAAVAIGALAIAAAALVKVTDVA